jgi:hypothetical protein
MSAVTVERWRRWWQQQLPVTSLWARVRGQLPSVLCLAALPSSLLECFVGSAAERMVALLRLLSPLSTQSCPERAWR